MTAHEMAKRLLEGPDLPVLDFDRDGGLFEIDVFDVSTENGEKVILLNYSAPQTT